MLFGYKILVFCTSKLYEKTFCDYISGLNEKLVSSGWRVFVFCVNTNYLNKEASSRENQTLCQLINFDITDAILVSDDKIQDVPFKNQILQKAEEHSIPAFVVEGYSEKTWNIRFNAAGGFEKVVRHVIETHKIRDVHFIAGVPESDQSLERLEVFKKVLAENNIPFNAEKMVSNGYFYDYPARVAVIKLIEEKRVPKAIICANDVMAVTTISVLKEYGYKCPEEVVVTGFDGIDYIYYSEPSVTSVFCDNKKLGIETADFIVTSVENNLPRSTKLIDTELIIQNSCGCNTHPVTENLDSLLFMTNAYDRYRMENVQFSSLSASIRNCSSIDEVFQVLKTGLLYNVFCAVRKPFIDFDKAFSDIPVDSDCWNEMCLLLDSDNPSSDNSYFDKEKNSFNVREYIPNMKTVLNDNKCPLVFTLLSNLELPIGYLCFCFRNFDVRNYTKIDQIAAWLGNSLSGFRNLRHQHYLQKKIEDIYCHDSLTGLYNRTGFLRVFDQIVKNDEISELSFIMCDLDNLKVINDKYGHKEGNNAICVVGNAIASLYKGSVCRYGGDEIIGVFTQKLVEKEFRQKFRTKIDEYNRTSGKPYKVNASLGLVFSKKTTFDKLFARADKRMYEEKKRKKKRWL